MKPAQLRLYLNEVKPETWADLGKFFVNYVTDEELERWFTYWNNTNSGASLNESSESFTQMLTYFVESVFNSAEKYHKMPNLMKNFLESSDNNLLYLGIHLNNSVKALETQKVISSLLETENYQENQHCDYCTCSQLLDEIKLILFSPDYIDQISE